MSAAPRDTTPHHLVTFYERDEFLVASVADFLETALGSGQPAIAVATATHLEAIEAELAGRGLRPDGAGSTNVVGVDAHELLERLTVNGELPRDVFEREISRTIEGVAPDGAVPVIFGEMVAILWEAGDVAGAIALEDRWNEFAQRRPFDLLCGYPMGSFDEEHHTEGFRAVCDRHTSIIPSESYTVADPHQQLRLVAELQQEATAGANERSALRRKQAELEEALERLRELDRLRNEFTAMVVHDIRSPASIAAGYLDLLLQEWDTLNDGEPEQFVGHALGNLRRIQRLVDDILTMSQLDSGEFTFELRPLDLGRVVERTASEIRDSSGRDIRVDLDDHLRPALADEDRQVQILTNLLSNAVKFSPEGTPIRVSVADRDGELVVTVSDEGVGIARSEQETLFRPFSRAGKSGNGVHGTGLGLYIARALVEGQGGELVLASDEGVGTTFTYSAVPAT